MMHYVIMVTNAIILFSPTTKPKAFDLHSLPQTQQPQFSHQPSHLEPHPQESRPKFLIFSARPLPAKPMRWKRSQPLTRIL
jgi:hypothetical protein